MPETTPSAETPPAAKSCGLWRLLPALLIAAGMAAALWYADGLLGFQALADNREALLAWRDGNLALAVAVYAAVYVAVVAFSVPGAVWLTIGGGFLFGTLGGTALTVVAATMGATLIFLAARTSLAEPLRARAGGWIGRIERQLGEDGAVSLLLVMRLVPAVPFFVANLAPAFLGIPARTFVWTTLVGIIPGTAVFASIGAGLGATLDRGEAPDLSLIFAPHVLGPLLGLAALAALPVIVRRLRRERSAR